MAESYLAYKMRMQRQGKDALGKKDWERLQKKALPPKIKPVTKKKKKKSDNGGPCFVGTVIPKDW